MRKKTIYDLMPSDHVEFYLKLYTAMREINVDSLPELGKNGDTAERLMQLVGDQVLPFEEAVNRYRDHAKKACSVEGLCRALIDRLKVGQGFFSVRGGKRRGTSCDYPLNFLIFALTYELRCQTGKPNCQAVCQLLEDKGIIRSGDYDGRDIRRISQRQDPEQLAVYLLACYLLSKKIIDTAKEFPFFIKYCDDNAVRILYQELNAAIAK